MTIKELRVMRVGSKMNNADFVDTVGTAFEVDDFDASVYWYLFPLVHFWY